MLQDSKSLNLYNINSIYWIQETVKQVELIKVLTDLDKIKDNINMSKSFANIYYYSKY